MSPFGPSGSFAFSQPISQSVIEIIRQRRTRTLKIFISPE